MGLADHAAQDEARNALCKFCFEVMTENTWIWRQEAVAEVLKCGASALTQPVKVSVRR